MRGRTERTISQALESMGFELVSVRELGEDPGTHTVRSIVIGKFPGSYYAEPYAVWNCVDWKKGNREMGKAGIELCNETARLTRSEAIAEEGRRYVDLMQRYTWLVPGTERLVPGCRGS